MNEAIAIAPAKTGASRTGRPTSEERDAFVRDGYVVLKALWGTSFAEELTAEAQERRSYAEVPDAGPRTLLGANRMTRKPTKAATGALLHELHVSLVGLVRALSGRIMVPTFSAYGYYETDDEVLLHLDTARCDVTLVTTAMGHVGPLHIRDELRAFSMDELAERETDPLWDRAGGIRVEYPRSGLLALQGNVIPHNRPGRALAEPSAVAALCYRSLF